MSSGVGSLTEHGHRIDLGGRATPREPDRVLNP